MRSIEDVEGDGDGELEVEENGTGVLDREWGSANEDTLLQVRQSGRATCVQMTRESKRVAGSHGISAFSMRLCKI